MAFTKFVAHTILGVTMKPHIRNAIVGRTAAVVAFVKDTAVVPIATNVPSAKASASNAAAVHHA